MIQIQEPQVEALLMERLKAGGFASIEQTLLDALTQAPPPSGGPAASSGPTGADIIAAFRNCPMQDFDFDFPGVHSPISDPVKF